MYGICMIKVLRMEIGTHRNKKYMKKRVGIKFPNLKKDMNRHIQAQ